MSKSPKERGFVVPPPSPLSHADAPGTYGLPRLKQLLLAYLAQGTVTSNRIRDIFLPSCLKNKLLTIEEFQKAFVDFYPTCDPEKIRGYMTHVSTQLGTKKNDFLRQVIAYEYPHRHWVKDNFSIKEQYRQLVNEVLEQLKKGEARQTAEDAPGVST